MEINETIELIENIEKQTNEEVDSEDKIFLEIFKNTLKTGISLCNGIKEGKYDDNDAIEIATCNITNANIQYFIEGKNSEFPYICNIFRLIDSFIHALIDLETEYSNKDIITFLINVFKQVRYVDFDRVSLDYITILYTYFRKIIDIYSSNFINDLNNLCEGNFKKVIKWTDKYELILRNRFGDELIVSYKENKLDVDLFLSHIVDKEIITDEDIFIASASLSSLGFDKEVVNIFRKTLLKEYKEKNKKPVEEIKPIVIKKEEHKSNLITDKEYKSILKEIRKYFNPYTNTLNVEELSDEERNHVLSLMVKIGIDKYSIMRFMNLTEKDIKEDYDYFKEHIEEYDYYYQEYMDTLMDYYNESLKCNPDEVEFWKDEINRILDNLKYDGKLYSYEYEIKKVMGNYGTNTGKC